MLISNSNRDYSSSKGQLPADNADVDTVLLNFSVRSSKNYKASEQGKTKYKAGKASVEKIKYFPFTM